MQTALVKTWYKKPLSDLRPFNKSKHYIRPILLQLRELFDDDLSVPSLRARETRTVCKAIVKGLDHYAAISRRYIVPAAKMLAVFTRRPLANGEDLIHFLEGCSIGVAWRQEGLFDGTARARTYVPWLFGDE